MFPDRCSKVCGPTAPAGLPSLHQSLSCPSRLAASVLLDNANGMSMQCSKPVYYIDGLLHSSAPVDKIIIIIVHAPQSMILAGLVRHAPALRHHPLGLGLCLSLQWMQRERERKREKRVCTQNTARRHKGGVLNRSDRNFRAAFSVYLTFLLARVALKLRPLDTTSYSPLSFVSARNVHLSLPCMGHPGYTIIIYITETKTPRAPAPAYSARQWLRPC